MIRTGVRGTVHVGGAGAFDSLVLAGILAVLLAELVGETLERLQGGPKTEGRPEELIQNLVEPDPSPKPFKPEFEEIDKNDKQDEKRGEENSKRAQE